MARVTAAVLCLSLLAAACGPKTVASPPVTAAPRFPDFIVPVVPLELQDTPAAKSQGRAWALLQAGDFGGAERELAAALASRPDFFPAETTRGWVEIARKDPAAALPHFARALERQPADPSALVGRGEASLALDREADALVAFRAAAAADPSLTEIARRVEVLEFRGLGQALTDARDAARNGRFDEAILAFERAIARSPDSAFLYRELAAVERRKGDVDAALEHLRRVVALDPGDAASHAQIGDILEAKGDSEGAAGAFATALALLPDAQVENSLERVRARIELARLPAEYRAIDGAPQVTRGDMAALIGVRLAPVLAAGPKRDGVVITDLRGHWAAPWIPVVVRAGVMEAFDNHTFQPRVAVRRVELAQIVGRLLRRVAIIKPEKAKAWENARGRFPDLATGNLAFSAASAAVASGVLTLNADGRFQPTKMVTGVEAVEAVRRLEALADLPSPPASTK